jgi:hypothetical protein
MHRLTGERQMNFINLFFCICIIYNKDEYWWPFISVKRYYVFIMYYVDKTEHIPGTTVD